MWRRRNHIQRSLVRHVHLPLPTPIKRTVRTVVRRLWPCSPEGRRCAQYSKASCSLSDVAWDAITSSKMSFESSFVEFVATQMVDIAACICLGQNKGYLHHIVTHTNAINFIPGGTWEMT